MLNDGNPPYWIRPPFNSVITCRWIKKENGWALFLHSTKTDAVTVLLFSSFTHSKYRPVTSTSMGLVVSLGLVEKVLRWTKNPRSVRTRAMRASIKYPDDSMATAISSGVARAELPSCGGCAMGLGYSSTFYQGNQK